MTLPEIDMNDENFNISIRKFLKMVGVSSQREIEQAVARRWRSAACRAMPACPPP